MTDNKQTPPSQTGSKKKLAPADGDPIEQAIANFEKKLCESEMEIKLADYLRLLQIRKEREELLPRDITVRWTESWEPDPVE